MGNDNTPLYTIGNAARLLGVFPQTLRLYESAGLLKPARRNNRRLYSRDDLHWLRCVRYLIHHQGLNQECLRRLLAVLPCWEIRGCPEERQATCRARRDRTTPCWDTANRACAPDGDCRSCEVYALARESVCSARERAAAELSGPPFPE